MAGSPAKPTVSARSAPLDGHPGLALQPTGFRNRISSGCDPARLLPDGGGERRAHGLDRLISDNRSFDVLPKGARWVVLRLIGDLGLDANRLLAAGDTLNDLSTLECRRRTVAVGGSEPALIERLEGNGWFYGAIHPPGCALCLQASPDRVVG